MKVDERPNLWTDVEGRRDYANSQYQKRKRDDPEKHRTLIQKIVRYARLRKYGVVGAPVEQPSDRCAFPGCDVVRTVGLRGLHADHDPKITDGSPNFRAWLCRNHNVAVGFFERYGKGCAEYLERFQ